MSNGKPAMMLSPSIRQQQQQQVTNLYDQMSNSMIYNTGISNGNLNQQPRNHLLSPQHPPRVLTSSPHIFQPQGMHMYSMQLSSHPSNQQDILPNQQLVQVDMSNGLAPNEPHSADGFPTPPQFEDLLNEYILSLSTKKRDKALIPQKRYDNIFAVLKDPKCTTIESAQFRFWAKKMFRLVLDDNGQGIVCHEGKPVAVREQLYDVLTSAHGQASHGGRDKTSAQVRRYYSWVPKELIARFVRNCPSCCLRRSPVDYNMANASQNLAFKAEQGLQHNMLYTSSPQFSPSTNSPQVSQPHLSSNTIYSPPSELETNTLSDNKMLLDPILGDTTDDFINSDLNTDPLGLSSSALDSSLKEFHAAMQDQQRLEQLSQHNNLENQNLTELQADQLLQEAILSSNSIQHPPLSDLGQQVSNSPKNRTSSKASHITNGEKSTQILVSGSSIDESIKLSPETILDLSSHHFLNHDVQVSSPLSRASKIDLDNWQAL